MASEEESLLRNTATDEEEAAEERTASAVNVAIDRRTDCGSVCSFLNLCTLLCAGGFVGIILLAISPAGSGLRGGAPVRRAPAAHGPPGNSSSAAGNAEVSMGRRVQRWQSNRRCTKKRALNRNARAHDLQRVWECDAASAWPCCSSAGHCGASTKHCECAHCIDYRMPNSSSTADHTSGRRRGRRARRRERREQRVTRGSRAVNSTEGTSQALEMLQSRNLTAAEAHQRLARTALLVRTMAEGPTPIQLARILAWSEALRARGVRTFFAADATAECRAAQCRAFLDQLVRWNVRVVVWDMDRTMSSSHCGSGLRIRELDDYIGKASSDFVLAARALAKDPRFVLAVATGSDPEEYSLPGQSRATHILGPDLARALLAVHCPEAASAFEVMVGFDSRLHGNRAADKGKRHHMRVIAEHYCVHDTSTMLLIDDSRSSLRSAGDGWRGVLCGHRPGGGFRFADVIGNGERGSEAFDRSAALGDWSLTAGTATSAPVDVQCEDDVTRAFPALLEPQLETLRFGRCKPVRFGDSDWEKSQEGRNATLLMRRKRSLGWGFHVEWICEWWARWRDGDAGSGAGDDSADGNGTLPIDWLWVVEDDVGFSGGDIGCMFADADVVGSDADLLHAPHSTQIGLESWYWRDAASDAFERLAPPLGERMKGSEHALRFSRALLDELHRRSSGGVVAWSECSAFTLCDIAEPRLRRAEFPARFIGSKFGAQVRLTEKELSEMSRLGGKLVHALKG